MKKTTLTLSLFLALLSTTYSQNCGITERESINNLTLSKAWGINTADGVVLTAEDTRISSSEQLFYFDRYGNLRKLIKWSQYSCSAHTIIAYYCENGDLVHIVFRDMRPEGYSVQGFAYKTYRGTFND